MSVPHIPALRLGRTYESLEKTEVRDFRTGEARATVSQVNAGIVRKDLQRAAGAREVLGRFTVEQLIEICTRAGQLFLSETLPVGDQGHTQSPDQFVETLSFTSGLPHVMVKRNMTRINAALSNVKSVLNGLSRGLDPSVLDRGYGEQAGTTVSFFPTTQALGVIMPSNSPAVNSLWLPAFALKTPIIIKPGREEPWTPYRLIQAFIKAGAPAEAFGFYPTDHEGSAEILRTCGRALLFGDKSVADQYANNPAVEVHGPGYSKTLIGDDEIENWQSHLDLMVESISANGGRSCLNASAVVVPKYAAEIADALAQRLGPIQPTKAEDPNAKLSGFANPKMAEYINGAIEDGLKTRGAIEATAGYRSGPRRVELDGGTFLRPTVVYCNSFTHPLANREFLFPYASVVQVPQAEMLKQIGASLVVTAITKDEAFEKQLLAFPHIQRLNLGPISTMKISWDQPHEGNMFEFLWKRRAFEKV
jgi:Aldehyde dehydrogenase family